MSILEAVTLGVVQGLTEFLPISSTAPSVTASRIDMEPRPGGARFKNVRSQVILLGSPFSRTRSLPPDVP